MTTEERLEDLLLRWQELYDLGRDAPVSELCRDCPELSAELARRIDAVRRMERLASSMSSAADTRAGSDTGPERGASATDAWLTGLLETAQQPDEVGRLGGYRVLSVLGQGGMGLVLRAEDPVAHRLVAIKVMRPEVADRADSKERFLREVRAAAAVAHDNVVPIWHVSEQRGTPFFVMPLLLGQTLEHRLRHEPPLSVVEVVRIGRETAEGLTAAHALGLIHRDVKPPNLWLEAPGGRVKLLDFGLARSQEAGALSQSGALLGTPGYMAPEQIDGLDLDGRVDLFALGCVLYRLLTGRPAFAGATPTAVLRATVTTEPPPPRAIYPAVPEPLSDLVVALMARQRDQRPKSARAVVDELRRLETQVPRPEILERLPTHALPTGAYRPLLVRRHRSRRWLALAAVVALLLSAGALLVWRPWAGGGHPTASGPADEGAKGFSGRVGGGPEQPQPVPFKGFVTLVIQRQRLGTIEKFGLHDAEALPLQPGDHFRIDAEVTPAAYLYLLRVDTDGEVHPVYPWQNSDWSKRPPAESPRTRLGLPERTDRSYGFADDTAGMETLVLVARAERWDVDEAGIKKLFGDPGPQRPLWDARSAKWFDNGVEVFGDPRRQRGGALVVVDEGHPTLRLQERLRTELVPLANLVSAVSFARRGR
jgi:serine/threonine protein kinase